VPADDGGVFESLTGKRPQAIHALLVVARGLFAERLACDVNVQTLRSFGRSLTWTPMATVSSAQQSYEPASGRSDRCALCSLLLRFPSLLVALSLLFPHFSRSFPSS